MNPEAVSTKVVREIVKEIWDSHEQVIDLGDQCVRLLRKHLPDISELEICDVLEDIERKVKSHLKREITRSKEKGITPRYEFSEVNEVLFRVRSIRVEEIKSKIKNINWRAFEYLCKHLLEINGIEKVGVTRASKEGGIDFYGLLPIDNTPGILLKGLEIRIIGQARHRSTGRKIGETEIKTLIQQFADFESGKGRGQKAIPDWFRILKTPLVRMIITNSEFTRDANDAAKEEGIIPRDGDQIAEDLIHSPEVDKWLSVSKEKR